MTDSAHTDEVETTPALDVDSILAIHRDHDGFVGFVRKLGTPKLDKNGKPLQFENLFSIPVKDLRGMFPSIADYLTHDSYCTINAPYRSAPWKNKTTGLPDVWRKETQLRFLTACYSDIDCGRDDSNEPGAEKNWRQAQYEAGLLMDMGIIPPASMIAKSGRGVYLLWFLRDDDNASKLPEARAWNIDLYKRINKALNGRLVKHQLPADTQAHDASRVLRVPGSIHRKAKRRVGYLLQFDEDGKGFTYTLDELARYLEVPMTTNSLPHQVQAEAKLPTWRRTKNKGSTPLRSVGQARMNALRCEDLTRIENYRGGFLQRGQQYPDGTTSPGRRFVLGLYAQFLRGSKQDKDTALQAVLVMAGNCQPPFPSDKDDPPVTDVVEAEFSKPRKWSNEKLCALLGVTPELARELELKTILPPAVKQESDEARPTRQELIDARRDFVRAYIERHGMKSARVIANVCNAHGMRSSVPTANKDLNALGFVTRDYKGGRPRRQYGQE